jgi:hypothetical protein
VAAKAVTISMNSRRLIVAPEVKAAHRIVADEHTERGYPKGRFAASMSALGQKHIPSSVKCQ